MKTAKSIDVAKLALRDNFGGITVSTLNEAAYFHVNGIEDILYAVCVAPQKMKRIAELQSKGCRITVTTDNVEIAQVIVAEGQSLDTEFNVMIEIDCGESRTGVRHDQPELLDIADILHKSPHVQLRGVLTHAGHSYNCRTIEAIQEVAEQERIAAVSAAEKLRSVGIPCEEVSVGSTPTALHARSVEGVTEVRPGVYIFGDLFQSEIHSCREADIAIFVLSTVISHRTDMNCFVIDAGALALSKDRSTQHTQHDAGYGLIKDASGNPAEPRMIIQNVHQEHGEVTGKQSIPLAQFPVGSRVRVLPNHACLTAAMYDKYYVIEDGSEEIIDVWKRTNGWD